jgi:hypothetical protein
MFTNAVSKGTFMHSPDDRNGFERLMQKTVERQTHCPNQTTDFKEAFLHNLTQITKYSHTITVL